MMIVEYIQYISRKKGVYTLFIHFSSLEKVEGHCIMNVLEKLLR